MISNYTVMQEKSKQKPGRGRRPINPDRIVMASATLTTHLEDYSIFIVNSLVFEGGAYRAVNEEMFQSEIAAEIVFGARCNGPDHMARICVTDRGNTQVDPDLVILPEAEQVAVMEEV